MGCIANSNAWWDGPSQQPSTHRAVCSLFPPFPTRSGNGKKIGRTRTRKLVDQNKDKEITDELLQLAIQTQLGEFHLKYLITDLGIGKQKKTNVKTLRGKTTPLPFRGSASLQTPLLPLVTTLGRSQPLQWGTEQRRRLRSGCRDFSLPLLVSHSFPMLQCESFTGCGLPLQGCTCSNVGVG